MSSGRIAALFQEGAGHHTAGRFEQAQAIHRRVIAAEPGHADCHFNLGLLAFRSGRNEVAFEHPHAAIAARQDLRARIARNEHRLYRDREAVEGLERYLEDSARGLAAMSPSSGERPGAQSSAGGAA
jgi:tetratricopeptide (TPR) repeat protein